MLMKDFNNDVTKKILIMMLMKDFNNDVTKIFE